MKDLPFFTTQNGIAGLILQEIPYNQKAYITIHDTHDLPALLQECVDFCKAVGAESVYACNHADLVSYPVYAQILRMERSAADLPETDAVLEPVSLDSMPLFLEIYNKKMKEVPAAKYLTGQRAEELLQEKNCYFVYRGSDLLGIGIAANGEICAVASLRPSAGKTIVLLLCNTMAADRICLEVADTNQKAIRLYDQLGFSVIGMKNIWYKIY